jgi:prophage regulatory protein
MSDTPPPSLGNRQARSDLKRVLRRPELRLMIPLADTTIYEMEKRGEFPRRFALTRRCVVWSLEEVEAWLEARRNAPQSDVDRCPGPDINLRKTRPIRAARP